MIPETGRREPGTRTAPQPWGVLGVPSSVAAHWPGIEKGPAALRRAGLIEELRKGAAPVHDFGDLAVAAWASARLGGRPNNADGVRDVLVAARGRIADVLRTGARPFVVGGECTLAMAMVSAFAAIGEDVGLVYVDGGQDLAIPADHPEEPILDSMGVAHLLDLPGTDAAVAAIGPRRPLLTDSDVVFLGYSEPEEDLHHQVGSVRIPAAEASAEPEAAARRALAALEHDRVVVHVDVDVLDFLEVPAADIAVYGRGLALTTLTRLLRVLLRDPRCAGALLVEYNPDHDPEGRAGRDLVQMLGDTLA